jgi:N-acetylmuramoyl-L-alanine amidase
MHQIRELQVSAFARGQSDIPYNFLIGGDGLYYEGRGDIVEGELRLTDQSFDNLGLVVAIMGNFTESAPSNQLNTLLKLLETLMFRGILSPWFKVLLESQLSDELPTTKTLDALKTLGNFYEGLKFGLNFG